MAVDPLDRVREEPSPVPERLRRLPLWPRFAAREVGRATIVLLVAAQAILWMVARPRGQSAGS
jgi:hypothetical protein